MTHTPGPWTTRESPEHWGRIDFIIHSEDTDVATAWRGNTETNRANASLISAAPDLLEALEEVLGWETLCPIEVYEQARAAIRKARGKA